MTNYIVNCYTCQHNHQKTCRGCIINLDGEFEPYQNWELRNDLAEKDKQIKELEIKQNKLAIEELNKVLKQLTTTTNPDVVKYLLKRIKELKGE